MINLEGQIRIPSGCAISGVFAKDGRKMSGENIIQSIAIMHERSNGLGGGFAAYGIYPEYKDYYALHLFFDNPAAREAAEDFLRRHFDITKDETIPTRITPGVPEGPKIRRYFAFPLATKLESSQLDEREFVAQCVFKINSAAFPGAFVFSSGKNMGSFKAVGYPEDVGRFYRLEEYEGYCFTAHGRYPTNTPGWWGGAHPFSLLDYTVVHNGEISSYDANRRTVEMYGYKCDLQTDTEAITYMIDYLHRKRKLNYNEIAEILAAPFWQTIDALPETDKQRLYYLRNLFSSFLITGPFSIIVGFEGGMMALNDRLKLRSMVAAEKGDTVWVSSEESAIRIIEPSLDRVWAPAGGEPVIATLNSMKGEV